MHRATWGTKENAAQKNEVACTNVTHPLSSSSSKLREQITPSTPYRRRPVRLYILRSISVMLGSLVMRLLHLTEFPWPATSGALVRTLSQLRIIASLPEIESVTLLSITEKNVSAADIRALEGSVEKLRVLPPIFHPIHLFDHKRYVPRVVALRLLGVPYLAGKWESTKFRRALRRELVAAPIDVAYIDHLGMGRYLRDIKADRPFCRTVLDEHNVESDFFKQFAAEKIGPKKVVATAEYVAARQFEERALRAVD